MRAWVVVAVVAAACSKREPNRAVVPVSPAPPRQVASSPAELDALWALAPSGTQIGAVASADGLDALERRVQDARTILRELPAVVTRFEALFGTTDLTRAGFGLPRGRAIAMFITGDAAVVLPVADREKLGARLHAQLACKEVAGRLACATAASALETLGSGKLGVADVGERGDIEVVIAFRGTPVHASVVAQFSPGTAIVHGAIANISTEAIALLGTAGKPSGDLAHAAGFFVGDFRPLLADSPVGEIHDLVQSFAGPIAATMPAGHGPLLDVRVPLSDPRVAQRLIDHCPALLGRWGATVANGTCHVPPTPLLPTPQALDIWIDGKELRIGDRAAKPAPAVPLGPLGELLARTAWAFAVYGHGTVLGTPFHDQMLAANGTAAGFAAFEEVAFAARVDGTTLRMLLAARTVWENPPDVVRALVPLVGAPTAKRAAEVAAIAARAPSSPFASAHRAGETGIPGAMLFGGLVMSVAIPMYLEHFATPAPTIGAPVTQLQQIGMGAQAYRRDKGTYPVGKAALRPDKPCCAGPKRHCPVVSWTDPMWRSLDFALDKPSLFQYAYRSDGKTFTATAIGDLDCDGISIVYTLSGNADGTTTLTEPTPGSD